MGQMKERVRSMLGREPSAAADTIEADAAACSWDVLRTTYEEQAARGVPEAIVGLERIEQGRWPTSGRLRDGSGDAE